MPALHEILDPARAAVLVVDVQNDFCSPEGATAKSGAWPIDAIVAMVPRLEAFLDTARRYAVPVIFAQNLGSDATDSEPWLYRASDRPRRANTREGTWGAELYRVKPQPGEPVVAKVRNNAFHNTRLESVLRTLGTRTLVVTGVATNVSVETTARDAVQRDYYVVLAEDCTAAYEQAAHDATIYNIKTFFGHVASAEAIAAIWKAYAPPA